VRLPLVRARRAFLFFFRPATSAKRRPPFSSHSLSLLSPPATTQKPAAPHPAANAVSLPDDLLREIFARLPWPDRVRASLVCPSWAAAARTVAPGLWACVNAARKETAAARSRRLAAHYRFNADASPLRPQSLAALADFICARRPRAVVGARASTVTPCLLRLVETAAAGMHTLGLRVDHADADGLAALVAALAAGGPASPLTCLELVLAPALAARGGQHFAPPPQRDAGWTLAGLGAAAPGLTRLVLEAPVGGWAAGPILAGLPRLAHLTLRSLPAAPRLFVSGPALTALTSLDLVDVRRLALPTGCLARVPLVRLRIWACDPVTTDTAVRLDSIAVGVPGWADPPRSTAAALEAAGQDAVDLLVDAGVGSDYDDLRSESDDEQPDEFVRSPYLNALADVGHTLRHFELVESPLPAGLFETILPALTRLRTLRLDTGWMSKEEPVRLAEIHALDECFAHERGATTETDLSPLLRAAVRLTEVRLVGVGHAFSLAAGAAARALRVLDLRGAHNSTWPAGLADAAPGLEELKVGFNAACVNNDFDDFDDEHVLFDLANPPALRALRCLVLVHAMLHLTGAVRAAAWARQLAAERMPALIGFEIDDRLEPRTSGLRAVSFIPAAYKSVHGRDCVLVLTDANEEPFGVEGCMEDDDWHDDTDAEEYAAVGLAPPGRRVPGGGGGRGGGRGVGWDSEYVSDEDTDDVCHRLRRRRLDRMKDEDHGRWRAPVEALTASAPHSWHAPGEPCPAVACGGGGGGGGGDTDAGSCDGGLCGDRAMRARLGVVVEGRGE
jgi:hypothetical protein